MFINETALKKSKILVVGDVILDQYYWTEVNRISPEAPVPICHIKKKTACLGGAGNVANNLSSFGINVSVMGVIGKDSIAEAMVAHFKQSNINMTHLIELENYPTICKTRVIAKDQQICRLDDEDPCMNIDESLEKCMNQIVSGSDHYDAIILSDYNKGVVSNKMAQALIQFANNKKIPIVVDPKCSDVSKYTGATYITPNLKEFHIMIGNSDNNNLDEIVKKGQDLIKENNIKHLILTRSENGMSHISSNKIQHYATKAIEVSDVTGAGDTVVAAIAAGASLNLDQKDIIHFANLAAGVVVSKVGTATATIQEIMDHEQHF
jgi:rfaE bifunctional protein kinase chain/domain